MAIHKAHNGFHQTITVSFVLFAVSSAMCSQFPASMKKKYVFYIDWAGLFNSIVANPDLREGGGWHENRLGINGRKQARQK